MKICREWNVWIETNGMGDDEMNLKCRMSETYWERKLNLEWNEEVSK